LGPRRKISILSNRRYWLDGFNFYSTFNKQSIRFQGDVVLASGTSESICRVFSPIFCTKCMQVERNCPSDIDYVAVTCLVTEHAVRMSALEGCLRFCMRRNATNATDPTSHLLLQQKTKQKKSEPTTCYGVAVTFRFCACVCSGLTSLTNDS
jgi:hypothetical protein